MGELFDRFDVQSKKGKEITIGARFPEVFISDTDEVFCYLGICLNDEDMCRKASFAHPYYMQGKHSTDQKIAKEIQGFYRLTDGCIILDEYVDNRFWGDRTYKKIEVGIRFPYPDTYYAVLVDRKEDKELTRAVFGLTYDEIESVLDAYAKTVGTYSEYLTYPKLTRSMRSANYCDLTDIWIPEKFPYIAFSESGYEFSHISLWGFYRYIQLFTGCKLSSAISRIFLKARVSEEILKRLFDIGRTIYYQTKVTKTVWE